MKTISKSLLLKKGFALNLALKQEFLELGKNLLLVIRDGPLKKLWGGGGGFSSRRNFFSLSNSLHEFFLAHSMNIF